MTSAAAAIDFERLFAAMPHPYLIVRADAQFTIVAANERYLEATGTERSRIVGRGLFEAYPDDPQDGSSSGVNDLRDSLERVLHDRLPDVTGVHKHAIAARDGAKSFRVKYWSAVNTPVVDADGSVSFIIHYVEDVTEFALANERSGRDTPAARMQAKVLRRARELAHTNRQIKASEARLAQMNERLLDLNRTKTEFFSNVSHEFRTPLTVILGTLELLLRKEPATPADELRASLQMIHRNALRLLKLVNRLLEFTRIEEKRTTLARAPTDLASFTAGIASNFEPLCARAGLRLHIDCPPLAGLVWIDQDMWERILLNLLSNAFKFTLKGEIRVMLRQDGEFAELTVSDTGTGIPAVELPRLFERFHRVRGTQGRSYEGSGIGLALVKEFVDLLSGTIAVRSKEGCGSEFVVRVPLHAAATQEPPGAMRGATTRPSRSGSMFVRAFVEEARQWLPETSEGAGAREIQVHPGRRVLVVDDNADMRRHVSQLLETARFEVERAADGEAALASCRARPPDLVLADVMMPHMDGFELVRRLRADPRSEHVPIILLSARAGEEARIAGMRSGADDYLVKPFNARELVARIEGALHRSAERKRAEAELRRAATVFTDTSDGVIITDASHAITAVNQAFTRITGFEPADAIGRNPRILASGRHGAAFYDALWQSLESTGQWQGEIWNRRKNGETYPVWESISAVRDERGKAVSYVSIFSDITSLKVKEDRLASLAHHDPLTGLPNRLLLTERLQQAIEHSKRHGRQGALLLLDLDRFKLINDTLGHAAGDRLLKAVAECLKRCVRGEDTVARLGGDEFVIVLPEIAGPQDAAHVAEKILHALESPLCIDGERFVISASLGISVFSGDARDCAALLQTADAAMYRAKHEGRRRFAFHTEMTGSMARSCTEAPM